MQHPALERARLLMDHRRHGMAAAELRRALRDRPEDSLLHAYLAVCLAEDPATLEEAHQKALWATAYDPASPAAWYALAAVERKRGRGPEAEQATRLALGLNPEAPGLFAELGSLMLAQERPRAALEEAERGLALDPDHLGCLMVRGSALSRLGRHDAAAEAFARATALSPEEPAAHAGAGWALLRRGDAPAALARFRESLRLDPAIRSAEDGLLEALRARSPVYRALLRASFRIPELGTGGRALAVVGGVVAVCVLEIARYDADLPALLVLPLEVAVVALVFLSWTARSLADLLLFSDPLARHVLSRAQRVGAVATAAALLLGAVLGLRALAGGGGGLGFAAAVTALYTLPIGAALRAKSGWPRALMTAYLLLVPVPAAVFLVQDARGAAGASTWFGITICALVMSDMVSDLISGRI
ncbi:MAG TPA: tetratricopeptide repeat protein [Longimicrobiaceae bacterium]|jgi:tetratricopeptide (TPR) repeat protein